MGLALIVPATAGVGLALAGEDIARAPADPGTRDAPRQPLKLWYRQPAEKWVEALPIGNGRLGAMVFGGADQARLQFNEDTMWSGRPHDYTNPEAAKVLPQVRKLIFECKNQEAERLAEQARGEDDTATVARVALRELHAACAEERAR